jgi:hypothetical protein
MQNQVPKSWILLFIAVFVVILAIYLTGPQSPQNGSVGYSEAIETSDRSTTFDQMLLVGDDAIYLENQTADASVVIVGYVLLSRAGYVVIYSDNDGVPGEVIGYSVLLEDGGEHVSIELNQPLVNDQVYYAVLYHDNNDQQFSAITDLQTTDSEESVVLMTFTAQANLFPETGAISP